MLTSAGFAAETPAADSSDAAAVPDDVGTNNDIVVTAERRTTSLMEVPMAVQVTSGDVLKDLRVVNVADLSTVIPTFTVSRSYQGAPQFSIRGIAFNAVNMSSSPTVTVYQNDVAFAYPYLLNGPMYDMQRVEVLKGPQGTLYGRNTTAGLINLIPNGPTDTFQAGFSVDVGNYDTKNLEGYVSGPITDTLKFRLAGRIDDSGKGWQTYAGPKSLIGPTALYASTDPNFEWIKPRSAGDYRLGEVHRFGARLALSWEATSDLDVDLVASMWKNNSDTKAAQAFAPTPNLRRGDTNSLSADEVISPFQAGLVRAPGQTETTTYFDAFQFTNGKQAGWNPEASRCADAGTTIGKGTGLCGDLDEDSFYFGGSLKIGYQLSDAIELTSITGYNNLDRNSLQDSSGAPFELLIQNPEGKLKTFSQELRLAGEIGPVRWTVGGYYGRDTIRESIRSLIGQNASARAIRRYSRAGRLRSVEFPGSDYADWTAPERAELEANIFRTLVDEGEWKVITKSISGSADWSITDRLTFTAGARYTWDSNKFAGCTRDFNGNTAAGVNTGLFAIIGLRGTIEDSDKRPLNYARDNECITMVSSTPNNVRAEVNRHLKENNLAWRLALNWRPIDDLSFYASASKGAKSGVIPLNTSSSEVQFTPVKQEIVRAYEGGGRWQFGRGGFVSVGGFYYDYKDKQLYALYMDQAFGPLARIDNIPKSYAYGIEGEFNLPVAEGFSLYGSGTYLKTKVTEYTGVAQLERLIGFGSGSVPVDMRGARFPYAPTWALNGGVRFEHGLVNDLRLRGTVNYRWQSKTISTVVEDNLTLDVGGLFGGVEKTFNFVPDYTIASYGLVNASLGFGPEDQKWEVSFWGRNIFDKSYASSKVSNGSVLTRYMGEPRSYGATFRYKF